MMNTKKRSGFSLIEVNMAIFVMATGVLVVAALYPMGLRESIESQADFKQVMFADYVLNIAVAAASSPDVQWSDWKMWASEYTTHGLREGQDLNAQMNTISGNGCVPSFIWNQNPGNLETAIANYERMPGWPKHERNKTYAIYCVLVPGFSDQIMGIMVRSLDMDTRNMTEKEKIRRLESQPLYYAEARFQGSF